MLRWTIPFTISTSRLLFQAKVNFVREFTVGFNSFIVNCLLTTVSINDGQRCSLKPDWQIIRYAMPYCCTSRPRFYLTSNVYKIIWKIKTRWCKWLITVTHAHELILNDPEYNILLCPISMEANKPRCYSVVHNLNGASFNYPCLPPPM